MADKITQNADGTLNVTDEPIIPFIEGDGTGVDIWPAAKLVLDAAAAKHGKTIEWIEVLAGEKAFNADRRLAPRRDRRRLPRYLIGIKGPLTTPVGGGFRCSTSRCARSSICTCACGRCAGSTGVPSPVKHPEKVDMVIFRENTEDIYAGLEVEADTPEAKKLADFVQERVRLGRSAKTRASASSRSARWARSA